MFGDTISMVDRKVIPINKAYVNLIIAVRDQAIEDGRLKEWEECWLGDPDFSRVLYMLANDCRSNAMDSNSGSASCNDAIFQIRHH